MSTTKPIYAALVGFISACSFDVGIPPIGTGPSESMGPESSDSGEDSGSDGPGATSTSGEVSGSGSSGTTEIGSGSGDGTSTGSSTGDLPVCEIVLDSMPGADGLCVCDGEPVSHQTSGPCGPCFIDNPDTCLCEAGIGPMEWCVNLPSGCTTVPQLNDDGECWCELDDGMTGILPPSECD